jgi:hypothetical protein
MKTFKQLFELKLNPKTKIDLDDDLDNDKVTADIELTTGEKFMLTITTAEVDPEGMIHKQTEYADMGYVMWEIGFEDETGGTGTTGKVGGKSAIELFAALESIIKNFMKKFVPEVIGFSGKGGSKTKLYKLLAKKMTKAGYVKLSQKEVKAIHLEMGDGHTSEVLFRDDLWGGLEKK